MTDENENTLSDEELDAYLAGRHEVTDAYKSLEQERSPRALDDKILAKARECIVEKPVDNAGRKSVAAPGRNYRPYAAAATVFLCLSVSFMFVNRSPVSESARESGTPVPSANQTAQSPAFTAEDGAAVAEDSALEEITVTGSRIGARREPAQAQAQAQAQARNLEELLELVEEARLNESGENRSRAQSVTAPLADVQDQPAYRNNRETWLAEIQRLVDADETDQAQSEIQLLLERYPDTDLEQLIQDELAEQE